jgi:hypothetical protein
MRENDIYRWYWKPGINRDYHCKSNLAVFVNGGLRDTFWYDWQTRSWLELEEVSLSLLGNIDDCTVISRWQVSYYRHEDIIDMNHSNNSNAPIYLKKSASKDQATILEYAEEKERKAYADKDRAESAIVEWEEKIRRIKEGDLEVYL